MKKILSVFIVFCFIVSCSSSPRVHRLDSAELKIFKDKEIEKPKEEEKTEKKDKTDNNEEDEEKEIKLINDFCLEERFQTNISYPLPYKEYDDSVVTNNFISFKAYKGQGYIYFHTKNIKKISLYLNNTKISSRKICKNEYSKIYIGDVVKNGENHLFISNIEPQKNEKGKYKRPFINIRIPYPKIVKPTRREMRKVRKDKTINYRAIKIIDKLIEAEIRNDFPSAQIIIIQNGKMIKNSAYGYISTVTELGYPLATTKRKKINTETLFDLASNTKMYSVNIALQKLVSEGKVSIDDKVQDYFPDFKDPEKAKITGKDKITIYDLLKHQAGFPAGGRYASKCKKAKNPKKTKRRRKKRKKKKQKVDNRPNKEITLDLICETALIYETGTKVKYSDIDYMLLGFIIEKITGMPLDKYVEEHIYKKLNLNRICYTPLKKGFKKSEIAASEINGIKRTDDPKYEKEKYLPIHGQVHDPESYGAMDEISGHAGLFANAESVAVLAQSILNGGGYDCVKLFDLQVLNLFTSPSSDLSPSGLGWRRQGAHNNYSWAFSQLASPETIGHTGWTGTFAEIDLNKNIVIVILTSAKNTKSLRGRRWRGKFEGDFYLLKNYGAITSFIYAGLNNYSDAVLDQMLIELAVQRYALIWKDRYYNNKGFRKDLKAIMETIKKESWHSFKLRHFLRSKKGKAIRKFVKL